MIRFGPATELVKKNYITCKKIDGVDYPHAIFKFKYRSRGPQSPISSAVSCPNLPLEALKSLLIVERTPSPEPIEEPVEEPALSLDKLNAAQKTRLEQFLRELVISVLEDQLSESYR